MLRVCYDYIKVVLFLTRPFLQSCIIQASYCRFKNHIRMIALHDTRYHSKPQALVSVKCLHDDDCRNDCYCPHRTVRCVHSFGYHISCFKTLFYQTLLSLMTGWDCRVFCKRAIMLTLFVRLVLFATCLYLTNRFVFFFQQTNNKHTWSRTEALILHHSPFWIHLFFTVHIPHVTCHASFQGQGCDACTL